MMISAFCVFRMANRHTFGAIFDRDPADPALRERLPADARRHGRRLPARLTQSPRFRAVGRDRGHNVLVRTFGSVCEGGHRGDRDSFRARARRRSRSQTRSQDAGRAALASWIGSVLEYYDFFIYGTAAALVFGKVFFPESDPATATLLSFATYGVGYVARPIGAFFMGHIGDKYGRKRVLLLTVRLMGVADVPRRLPADATTTSASGRRSLLVALRLLQGFSASGEQSGANSLSLEHAPEHRRAFFTSFTLGGTQAGLIIATAVFLPIGAMPEEQLLSWGWRIPFWLSAVVVVVGLLIRRRLEEPPAFRSEAGSEADAAVPTAVLFRDHWPAVLRVVLAALASTVSTIFAVYALSFAVDTKGLDQTTMLWVAIVSQRGRARRDPGVGDAGRPHRPQAGVHLRRARQRRADVRLPRRDRRMAATR